MCHLCCLCCRKVFCLDCLTNKSQIPKVSKLKIVPVLLKTTNDVIKKKKSQNKYEISEQTHLMQLNKLKNQTDNTNKTISDDLLSTKGKIANLFTARSTWEKRLTLEKPKNKVCFFFFLRFENYCIYHFTLGFMVI